MTEPLTLFLRAFGPTKPKPVVRRRTRAPLDVTEREWRRLRDRVFARDGYACVYCRAKPPLGELQADHVVPRALDGRSTIENLATSCGPCNRAKGASPLHEWQGAH